MEILYNREFPVCRLSWALREGGAIVEGGGAALFWGLTVGALAAKIRSAQNKP